MVCAFVCGVVGRMRKGALCIWSCLFLRAGWETLMEEGEDMCAVAGEDLLSWMNLRFTFR